MHVVYDVETFPNLFTCIVMPFAEGDDRHWTYEISERRSDATALYNDLSSRVFTRMYGYNSMTFDYPLLHYFVLLMQNGGAADIPACLWDHAQRLIAQHQGWMNHIRPWEMLVPQVDLLMVNHFDNVAKMTSLKTLEFNIKSPSLEEMPIEVGATVTLAQIPEVLSYNLNDVRETKRFAHLCRDAVRFREQLVEAGTFGPECLNWNDTKIGERFFIKQLEIARPGITKPDAHGRKPGTWRDRINLADVIVPYVAFERAELRDMLERLKGTSISGMETRNAYKYSVSLDGFEVDIGQGGIHGSVDRRSVRSCGERVIIDIDVTGYYPSLAIVNRFYPAHIGPIFCDVYREIRDDRAAAKKAGDVVKAGTLKLATNGAFGKTGSQHSCLYDPSCMMAITLNGQLLQCLLAEALLRVPGLELLQMNTDGLTVTVPRWQRDNLDAVCTWWQRQTCLELEFAEYAAMHIRDCNNYLAVDTKGKVKRKGEYDWEMLSGSTGGQKAWNRDFSALVVPKAAEAAFLHDQDPADFIDHHPEPYDFLLRGKVTGASRLILGHSGTVLGKTVRYYISRTGEPLVKLMPPLAGKTAERRIGLHAEGQAECLGERKAYRCSMCDAQFTIKAHFEEHNKTVHAWPVTVKNQWDGDLSGLDRRWYVQRAEGLLF